MVAQYFGVLRMDLALCFLSGVQTFQVVPRYLEKKMYIPALKADTAFRRNLLPSSSSRKFLPHCTALHHVTGYSNLNIHNYQNIAPQVYSPRILRRHCCIPVLWPPETFLKMNFSALEEQRCDFMVY